MILRRRFWALTDRKHRLSVRDGWSSSTVVADPSVLQYHPFLYLVVLKEVVAYHDMVFPPSLLYLSDSFLCFVCALVRKDTSSSPLMMSAFGLTSER